MFFKSSQYIFTVLGESLWIKETNKQKKTKKKKEIRAISNAFAYFLVQRLFFTAIDLSI